MNSLNLYKDRKHSVVKVGDEELKIPNEYTVEEVERILELRAEREALENEEVVDKEKQLEKFWNNLFSEIEILFQHYQPEITAEELKQKITHNEALAIVGFFDKYRPKAINETVKKKVN